MPEIKLHTSPKKAYTLLLGCLPFIIACFWMAQTKDAVSYEYYIGWVGACFFELGIPVALYMLFDRRPQIIITEKGIWDRTLKIDEIKWDQILDAYAIDHNGKNFVPLVTTPDVKPAKERKWVNWLNNELGFQKINLNVANVNVDADALALFINQMRATETAYRANWLRQFDESLSNNINDVWSKIIGYTFVSIVLLVLSLYSIIAFTAILAVAALAAIVIRWNKGDESKAELNRYAMRVVMMGAINLFLTFCFTESFNYSAEKEAKALVLKIENYKRAYGRYPEKIPMKDDTALAFPESVVAGDFKYRSDGKNYWLTLKTINNKTKEYSNLE